MKTRLLSSAFLFVAALIFSGCPEPGASSGGPVDVCVKAAERCRYQGNIIGVCFENIHGELECRAQH